MVIKAKNLVKDFAESTISFNQIFASTLATQAWSGILLYDKHLSDLGFELAGIFITSILVMLIGTILYYKSQLKQLA